MNWANVRWRILVFPETKVRCRVYFHLDSTASKLTIGTSIDSKVLLKVEASPSVSISLDISSAGGV